MGILDTSEWSLWLVIAVFTGAAVTILLAGTRMTRAADRLADITDLGEALFGAVLLGGSTSLPGIVTSVTTASQGYAELSISNAVGGITAQTAFLAVADFAYRGANLEHAAASLENLLQGALLLVLLAIPLLVMASPAVTVLGLNPGSIALVLTYVFGIRLIGQARTAPLWSARDTKETRLDEPDEEHQAADRRETIRTWVIFGSLALVVGFAGYLVAQTGISLADRTGMSETVVGALLTAVATSLPELVTSVAAVRRGALTLAVGGVIGGNAFDVLFVAFADAFYQAGSIYHAITDRQIFIFSQAIILNGVLLLGLLRREKHGVAGVGFESMLVLIVYAGGFLILATG